MYPIYGFCPRKGTGPIPLPLRTTTDEFSPPPGQGAAGGLETLGQGLALGVGAPGRSAQRPRLTSAAHRFFARPCWRRRKGLGVSVF